MCGYLVSPGHHNPLRHALFLSYRLEPLTPGTPVMYGKGSHDATFVAFYTIVLSFTREFVMQRLLQPMALRYGIRGRGKQYRFMEQAYTALYFSILGPLGLYIMSESPLWYFNTTAMFENYPHRTHTALFKAYYLIQFSYWAQQAIVLVLLLEKPRKDFKELVLHHIITLTLIALSYHFHFTYMGLLVYITHDISDLFLAVSESATLYQILYSSITDFQNAKLYRLCHCRPLLWSVYLYLDLSPPLSQLDFSLGRLDRISHRGTL